MLKQTFDRFLLHYLLLLFIAMLLCSERNSLAQNTSGNNQVLPMLLPQIVQNKGRYYLISQGYSAGFKKQFNLSDSAIGVSSNIIIYEFIPHGATLKRIFETEITRSFFGACMVANKIYIAGGYNEKWEPTKNVFEFDLDSKKWRDKNDMFIARANFSLEYMNGKIYAISGKNTKGSIEVYKPSNDLWELVDTKYIPAQLKPIEKITASAVIEDKIYLLGNSGASFQIFSPQQNLLAEGPLSPVKSDYFDKDRTDIRHPQLPG